MSRTLLASVARSVDVPRELVPHMERLFGGLASLGSSPRMVVGTLRRAGIGAGDRVLDLACGKGAAGVAAARALGCRVVGVDAYGPFLKAAEAEARRAGVEQRCEWRCGDARRVLVRAVGLVDAAMMIGLDSLVDAAPRLRRLVRPGGVYVIDDVVAMRGVWAGDPVGEGVPTLVQAREFLWGLGDEVLEATPMASAQARRINAEINAALRKAAAGLARERPGLRAVLRRFVARQREAGEFLEGPLRAVLFVARRGRG